MSETARITTLEFEGLLAQMLPTGGDYPCSVISLGWGEAVVRLAYRDNQLRPGGTLSGPTMMTLADTALYGAVLSRIGLEPLAVTSDLDIHFLRKPEPRALVARAKMLRVGRRNAVGTVEIASEGEEHGTLGPALVAHATGTYAIP